MVNKMRSPEQGETYSIGDLSREFGVTLRALRFYEDKGLLAPAREGTSRLYSGRDRSHLELILRGKRLGFTLVEISEMIARGGKGAGRGLDAETGPELAMSRDVMRDQIEHLRRQRADIDQALAELERRYEAVDEGA